MRTTPEAKAEELYPAAGRTLAFWATVVGELQRRLRSGAPLSRAKRRRLRERKAIAKAMKP